MPKKTKQEKILADYRKKIRFLEQNVNNPLQKKPTNNYPDKDDTIQAKKPIPVEEKNSLELQNNTTIFMADFKKSLVLTLGIIALEIFLYFATINHYFKFF